MSEILTPVQPQPASAISYDTGGDVRLRVFSSIPEDVEFRKQWDDLVLGAQCPEVFYTWEWAEAVLRAYGRSLRPMLFAGHRQHQLIGIAALNLDPDRYASFLTATTADYCDFVSTAADREIFLYLVMGELRRMRVRGLRLANLPADSASVPAVKAAAQVSGYSVFVRPAYVCAQVDLRSQADRHAAAESARRRLKKLAGKLEEPVLANACGEDDFRKEFPSFSMAHVARFLATGRISNLVRSDRRGFLQHLANLLSPKGWLALSTLKFGGRSIAWNYGFCFAGKWFYYQPTFNPEHRQLSPGSNLLSRIILQAAEDPAIHSVDLGLGEEHYKHRYAQGARQTLYVTGSCSKTEFARSVCRTQLAQWAKRSPRIERHARAWRSGIGRIKGQIASGEFAANARRSIAPLADRLAGRSGPHFIEVPVEIGNPDPDLKLLPVSLNLLAEAAMQYEDDAETLEYLRRCAARLDDERTRGFVLTTRDFVAVHFCWTVPASRLRMPGLPPDNSVLLIDPFTPVSQRGRRYEAQCASRIAANLRAQGKQLWACNAGLHIKWESILHGARASIWRRAKWLLKRFSLPKVAGEVSPGKTGMDSAA
ncbi:MAG TPA: GNAT family N-acetyltransferase [Terriglobales bacterium]|nr:GNAT family N-acetyltransferase [Terriglobales bacterium]